MRRCALDEVALEVGCSEVKQLLDTVADFTLLDCRELNEYEVVKIEGATLLPMSEIAERREELAGKEEASIVVHCHHGTRSAQVAAWLRQQGFAKAQSMAGGIDAWVLEIEPGMKRY